MMSIKEYEVKERNDESELVTHTMYRVCDGSNCLNLTIIEIDMINHMTTRILKEKGLR